MKHNMQVLRRATAADYPAIKTLIAHYPAQLMQEHLPEPEEFFIIQLDRDIIGCCALEVYSQRLAEIRSLAVREDHRHKGLGSQLVDACLAAAKDAGILEILTITNSPTFFETRGFGAFKNEKYALLKVL
ncbi:GNAT family N-acetyltransferase [Candidatus Kaiserbacteria bacterium]|nr:GNAT family N-acetyltransferase [Candidatus Kaiserbacteria bacterium]